MILSGKSNSVERILLDRIYYRQEQFHRVSHFNCTRIALTAFLLLSIGIASWCSTWQSTYVDTWRKCKTSSSIRHIKLCIFVDIENFTSSFNCYTMFSWSLFCSRL